MPKEATVLLVEPDDDDRERLTDALAHAGHEVIPCPGPTAPDYTCIGGTDGYCPLVETADVVVFDPWLPGDDLGVGTSAAELCRLYAESGRTVIVLGSGGWLDPFVGGHVVRLEARPEVATVVAAVRDAPESEGFVLRRPTAI